MKEKEGAYIRSSVFGFEDGLVSTLGVVIGLTTAALSKQIIITATIIEIFAAAVSMAAGSYLSTKTQMDFYKNKNLPIYEHPIKSSILMFVYFIIGALVPITPYLLTEISQARFIAFGLSAVALFAFGAATSKITKRSWLKSGGEMLIIGAIASAAGFVIGSLFNYFWVT